MATTIDLGKIRMKWKGAYSAATTYEKLDTVTHGGDVYIYEATSAASGQTPSTSSSYWELMVPGGDQWSSGTAVPTGGNDGDMYLKTDDEKVYKNTGGTWAVILDIGGGVWTSSAANGTGGESGDWHVNTATKDIQENVSGTWTTRVNLSVSGSSITDLSDVAAYNNGKFLKSTASSTEWAVVDTDATMGGDLSGTASNAQLVANAVGTSELATDSVTNAKIATNAVNADSIAADAVGSSEIAANAVGGSELANGSIGTDHLSNSSVTDAKISGMSSSKLSGALPAIDGSNLTGVESTGAYVSASSSASGSYTGLYSAWNLHVQSENMTMGATYATCVIPGIYYFYFSSITPNSTAGGYECQFVKNGAGWDANNGRSYTNAPGHDMFNIAQVFRLEIGDTVALRARDTGYVYGGGHGFMRGIKVGD